MGRTTTEKGLGKKHQDAVKYLKQRHVDGSPCEWCGRPMWLDATLNYDYNPEKPNLRGNGVLQGDHSNMSRAESLRMGLPVLPPDRLLHARCNNQRGQGENDHLAVTNAGSVEDFTMPWPWIGGGE